MKKNWPTISVILPTYNEEKNLPNCLRSIANQDYPIGNLEILVVDDGSTDGTLNIAKQFKTRIIRHQSHNCEMGRSLGLTKAKSELVLIIDADNILSSKSWLKQMARPFLENQNLVGSQTGWYQYDKFDKPLNRYGALFGATKPMSFYLKKRNFLMATEKDWMYPKTLMTNKTSYFLVSFTPENMPTLGSQGFLGRKSLLLQTHYHPYYYHMDSLYELVKKNKNLFAIVKQGIIHRSTDNFWTYHQKFYRDAIRFFRLKKQRRYFYQSSWRQQLVAGLKLISFMVPLFDSLRGFMAIRDLAWFWHPIICSTSLWLTLIAFLANFVKGGG